MENGMLASFLRRQPLEQLLTGRPYHPFPAASDRAAWDGIPPGAADALRRFADDYRGRPYPMRLATEFLAFVRTGSRAADETPYFFRRKKLCAAVLDCCLDPSASPDAVVDGIWCICEESSWVISAHNVNPIPGAPAPAEYPLPDTDRPYVDLFAAQTAMILSLTDELLGETLDGVTPLIRQRLDREIRRRLLDPFMATDDFWWMGVRRTDLCNWTPWILSNVMLCACLRPMDERERCALLNRACEMLDRWLRVVPEDGGCDEGAGYWNMAGGALLDCLELLSQITGGRMTFWQEEKIRHIASFPQKAALGNGWFVNFADCDARPLVSGERLQYAGEMMEDSALASLGSRMRAESTQALSDVPHFLRLLKEVFHPPLAEEKTPPPQPDVWLPDLQLRLVRRGPFALCCKGGCNGESHNHNDVGSFILFCGGEPEIVDAGNMNYTAVTFSERRYTLWNTRSAYHNLPLIGEAEQVCGREAAARGVRRLPDGMSLELSGAYPPEAGLQSLQRTLTLTEAGLTLRDEAVLERARPVTWVFMLRNRPELHEGFAEAGSLVLRFPAALRAAAEEMPVTDSRMARSFPGSLWRLTLTSEPGTKIVAVFTAERRTYA